MQRYQVNFKNRKRLSHTCNCSDTAVLLDKKPRGCENGTLDFQVN